FHQREVRGIIEEILDGGPVLGRETELDGRTILLTGRPLPNGGAVLVLHDVTDLKRLDSVRRDFVANVSHELKTPLTSISGYAETLLSDTPDEATRKRFLEVIAVNATRMQHLVDDLLDLARLESGQWQVQPQPTDIAMAGREAFAAFTERAAQRGVRFDLDVPPGAAAWVDPEAFRQVLDNLFDNAVRHTPQGGRILLTARPAEDAVEVAVQDTGSGIPHQHLHRVFERFYRADPGRSRQEGGTGLGLAIVKHLVEAHGGTVSIESAVGEGTTVRMHFPNSPPEV
ncbi:MAG: sensor histidine kinase, partial [Gemmatimonadales bacterium]